MKKITLIVGLLGTVYLSNAQVGIGTPQPHQSSLLDVVSQNKGVLIPRVSLVDSKTMLSGNATQEQSLMVYNIATTTGPDAVSPGFYYWVPTIGDVVAHWERVINQTQFSTIVQEQATDLQKYKQLLDAAYGSNNLGDVPTNDSYGGMVFTPATSQNAPKIEYVKWNAATLQYDKTDVTSLITGFFNIETNLVKNTTNKYQYYISETFISNNTNNTTGVYTPPTTQVIDTWGTTPPAGVYLIDFVDGIVNNFNEIVNSSVVVNGVNYTSVTQYIESLAQDNLADDVVKIVFDANGQASFQKWDNTNNVWVAVADATFSKIVKTNETKTTFKRLDGRTFYFSELFTNDPSTITTASQAINAASQGVIELHMGNTGYTTVDIPSSENPAQLAIPANSLYYIDSSGSKIQIPFNELVHQGVMQFTQNQINSVKNKLGDHLTAGTSVFTGDTITIEGTLYYIYKGSYTTIVTAGSANTSGFSVDRPISQVLSVDLRYNNGLTAGVTDLVISNQLVGFKIGTGGMYFVLNATSDVTANVVVEFASTQVPTFAQ